ncbi:Ubiquitin carboxyl-terminal hydrolase family protein [Acanthocheilonema viteae]
MGCVTKRRNTGTSRRNISNECEIPDEIDFDAAWNVYMLNKSACLLHYVPNPKTKNCRDNPYCLGRLGLEKWDKLLGCIKNENKTNTDLDRRDIAKMPCGLVNLGNSCYVNSFLQIFFNDPVFRKCIYDWRPVANFVKPEGEKINIEELMHCIQKLFVTLQITPYEDTSAEGLVKLLQLDGNQHDALEFQILFFGKLEKLLSYHVEWHEVRETILKRFQGVITQTISCKCGRRSVTELPFNPFYLSIEKARSLSKALEYYFLPEELPDYKCSECGQTGSAQNRLAIKEPPPVLTIQLNRFTYDAVGHKKKIHSPLQYPRVLQLGDVKYDICAVMIHEGPNADCGHYYDLIKHPGTRQWFTYNDEVVKPSATPGVCVEKERTSKVTADMKGCYALVYRRENEENSAIPDVPKDLLGDIASKLEEEFIAQTSATTEMTIRLKNTVEDYHKRLTNIFDKLEVKKSEEMLKNPDDIVFIPTDLFSTVLSYEFSKMMESNDEVFKNVASSIRSATVIKSLNCKNTDENRAKSSFSLCAHNRVSLGSVRSGAVKAVMKSATSSFLTSYGVEFIDLKTGSDICLECVKTLKARNEFVKKVQLKERLVKQLLREKSKRYYHSENCFWVSVRCLSQYRQLALRAHEQSMKSYSEVTELNYFWPSKRFGKQESIADCDPSTSEISQRLSLETGSGKTVDEFGLPDDFGPVTFSSINGDSSEIAINGSCNKKNSSAAGDTSAPNAFVDGKRGNRKRTALCCKDEVDDSIIEKCTDSDQISVVDDLESCKKQKLFDDYSYSATRQTRSSSESPPDITEVPDVVSTCVEKRECDKDNETKLEQSTNANEICNDNLVTANFDECGPSQMHLEKGESKQRTMITRMHHQKATDDNTHASSESSTRPRDTLHEDLDCVQSDDDDEEERSSVVFNGDLRCEHGLLDYECWMTNERRIVVDENEWKQLTVEIFEPDHLWCVSVDEFPCSICKSGYLYKKDDWEETLRRMKEIRLAIGELIRTAVRRTITVKPSPQIYERVICRNFLKNMISRFKSRVRNPTIPTICQDCMLCSQHKKPCVLIDNTEGLAVPLTLEEWQKILAAMQINDDDVMLICLDNKGVCEMFCDECFRQQQLQVEHQRFVYENGAEIYVKLKNDKNDEPIKTANGDLIAPFSATPSLIRPERHATTRRAVAKCSMVFKMTSLNTIHQLKIKIYQKTGQLPNDQLIYMKERLLNDSDTLEEARVDPQELIETPLTLIVQQPTDIPTEPRQLERGFADTALSHS